MDGVPTFYSAETFAIGLWNSSIKSRTKVSGIFLWQSPHLESSPVHPLPHNPLCESVRRFCKSAEECKCLGSHILPDKLSLLAVLSSAAFSGHRFHRYIYKCRKSGNAHNIFAIKSWPQQRRSHAVLSRLIFCISSGTVEGSLNAFLVNPQMQHLRIET